MILNICDSADILKVMRIIKIVIIALQILVPIILIVVSMISFTKAVASGENKKAINSFKLKLLAAVIIFLVPTFVNLLFKLVDQENVYYSCIQNATKEGISRAYSNIAIEQLNNAISSLNSTDYNLAVNSIKDIEDKNMQAELLIKAGALKKYVEINSEISDLINKYDKEKYEKVGKNINSISDENIKKKLLDRYNMIKHYEKTDTVTVSSSERYHINGYTGIKYYLYNQCEGTWRNISLAGGKATFCDIGCGLTTCTVLISAYNTNVKPTDSVVFGDDYHHDTVIESQTNNGYDCTIYDKDKISNQEIISNLEKGNVVSLKVWGSSLGGKSKFTGSQHYMALIDYTDGKIFVGNAYNCSYDYGCWGWYDANDVLTSIQSTVVCVPKK